MTMRRPRPAARLLVVDGEDRVLLFRFDTDDRPPFWCTPGGALDPGETYAEAAHRELMEETGIDAPPGPEIAQRTVDFLTIEGVEVTADERWFRVNVDAWEVDTSSHTELERRVMTQFRWFSRHELSHWHERIYPDDIVAMLKASDL